MAIVPRVASLIVAAILLTLATACGQFQSGQTAASVPAASEVQLTGVVATATNVWKQPNVDDTAILGQIAAGTTVKLRAHDPETTWYIVETPDGLIGWMRAPQLRVDKAIAAQVPASAPSECNCGAHAGND